MYVESWLNTLAWFYAEEGRLQLETDVEVGYCIWFGRRRHGYAVTFR